MYDMYILCTFLAGIPQYTRSDFSRLVNAIGYLVPATPNAMQMNPLFPSM